MGYKIGVDPGTNATGLCFFLDGKVRFTKTLRPPDNLDFLGKLFWQRETFDNLLVGWDVSAIAVEDWEIKHHKVDAKLKEKYGTDNKEAMVKCATIRGMLLTVAGLHTVNVMLVSKRKITKAETAMLAKAMKVAGSKDALDAFHIGIIAGFDR